MGVWDGVDANATDKYLSGFLQKKYLSGLTGCAVVQEEARQVPGHQAAMANARTSVLLPHTSRATGKRADVLRLCHGSPLGLIYR
jgi:hypothetical protein